MVVLDGSAVDWYGSGLSPIEFMNVVMNEEWYWVSKHVCWLDSPRPLNQHCFYTAVVR